MLLPFGFSAVCMMNQSYQTPWIPSQETIWIAQENIALKQPIFVLTEWAAACE
jgi:hypothetical protein